MSLMARSKCPHVFISDTFDSIVSIPSLPQLLPSYQPRDETAWIRDVFAHHFPTARVLLFRYDFAKSPTDDSWLQILREGTTLLYGLIHQRSRAKEMNRPLVFLCHSFGGMVLKQVRPLHRPLNRILTGD